MKEIVVLVRYPKSLNWEAAPKPYPFLQSENVLQPKGNWTRTLQWNTLEGLCTQEMSQGRVAAVTSSPQSQLFNAITESEFLLILSPGQTVPISGSSGRFSSAGRPPGHFHLVPHHPVALRSSWPIPCIHLIDRRREGLRRRRSMPLLFWPGNDTSFPFTFHGLLH